MVSASLSARLRRERKADEKTERFNRMLDVCVAAEDFLGAERIFQRLVILGTLVVSFGLLIADMVVDFLATVFALLFCWYDLGYASSFPWYIINLPILYFGHEENTRKILSH